MGILELLTSIWNYIKEIPENIVNFFNGLGNSITFLNDIKNFVSNNITGLINTLNGNTRSLSFGLNTLLVALAGSLLLAIVFILIDIIRDVL